MDNNIVSMLVTGVMITILFVVILWFIISLSVFIKLKNQFEKDNRSLKELEEGNKTRILDYSKQVLEFIRMMIGQVSVIKFRTFIDGNKLDKTTKQSIEKIVADVATTVHNSINTSNIALEDTIYSEEFFDQYIIETSSILVKELLDKAVGQCQDVEE